MSERGRPLDEQTMSLGLLMEAAQAQKSSAEAILEKLNDHVRGLDAVVRDEIRRTLVHELELLGTDSRRAAEALRALIRAANLRTLAWSIAVTVLAAAIPLIAVKCLLPSRDEVAALQAKRDALASNIAKLQQRGGLVDMRRCGDEARLCIRIDRKAPAYGESADYLVVKGY
jgi:uncharacterized protein involved in exopolysaccharide biosynthesis